MAGRLPIVQLIILTVWYGQAERERTEICLLGLPYMSAITKTDKS